jgi:hypothetical protein
MSYVGSHNFNRFPSLRVYIAVVNKLVNKPDIGINILLVRSTIISKISNDANCLLAIAKISVKQLFVELIKY